jgi:hypothetical protein
MTNLTESIQRFSSSIQQFDIKASLLTLPKEQLELLKYSLLLSAEIEKWYASEAIPVNVIIRWTANELVLYSPLNLLENQAGYRWNTNTPNELLDDWNINWLVIGDIGGDPIIAHIDKVGTPISMALHGMGYWNPLEVAPDLATFLDILNIWVNFSEGQNGGVNNLFDDNGLLRFDVATALHNAFLGTLEDEHRKNLVKFLLG